MNERITELAMLDEGEAKRGLAELLGSPAAEFATFPPFETGSGWHDAMMAERVDMLHYIAKNYQA